jgi:hypothetical protein
MTRENLTTVIVTLGAVLATVIALFWPAQAGTYGELLKVIIAALLAIVAILYPSGKAVVQVYQMRARAAYYSAVKAGAIKAPAGSDSIDETTIEGIMNWIKKELDGSQTPYLDTNGELLPIPVAPQLLRQLTSRWNNPNVPMDLKMKLLSMTVDFASRSFKEGTGLEAPTKYTECDDVQEYWFANKPTCKIQSAALFRMVLSPIRDALKIRDTGAV